MGFPGAEAGGQDALREVARSIVLFVRAQCPNVHLGLLGHLRRTDLEQEMAVTFICKAHHLMGLQLFGMPPHPGQAFHPLRIVICGHRLGPCPAPADLDVHTLLVLLTHQATAER
jgi:hypothetical protein